MDDISKKTFQNTNEASLKIITVCEHSNDL